MRIGLFSKLDLHVASRTNDPIIATLEILLLSRSKLCTTKSSRYSVKPTSDNRRAEADLRRSRSKALSLRDSLVALESHAVDEIPFENSITKFHRKRSVAIREIVYTQTREEEL